MTRVNGQSRSLTEVLAANCKRIRGELKLSQDQLAAWASGSGLRWNAGKVANFEAGRWTPTLADVLALGVALERALTFRQVAVPETPTDPGRTITLADLLDAGDGPVTLKPGLVLTGSELTGIGRGEAFPRPPRTLASPPPRVAEQRLARALGIEEERLAELSQQLWGTTFTAERDRRAGAGNQQKKGQISRELRAELEKEIKG